METRPVIVTDLEGCLKKLLINFVIVTFRNSEHNISNKRLRFTQERMKSMIVNPSLGLIPKIIPLKVFLDHVVPG